MQSGNITRGFAYFDTPSASHHNSDSISIGIISYEQLIFRLKLMYRNRTDVYLISYRYLNLTNELLLLKESICITSVN